LKKQQVFQQSIIHRSRIYIYLAAMKMGQSFSISLCVGIALLFLWQIFLVSNNTPYLDDVNFIDFILHFADPAQKTSDFLTQLFMVDNNHMAVVPKLGLSLQYLLFEEINFKRILLISAFQLGLIGVWFFWQFKETQKPFWMALPLLFLWFQPQYYEISNWAMTGIQQSSVILFSILALECIAKPGKKYFVLANVFAGLAFYSFGSGILAFAGIGYYMLAHKRYREIVWLFPLPVILLASYLFMKQLGSVANTSTIQVSHAIPFFLNLIGTIAMVISSYAKEAAWILGTLMLTLALGGLVKINHQSKISALLLMLLANCLLIVISRDGLGIFMVSRFATLSPLFAMCLYLLYLPKISTKIAASLVILTSLFWAGSYVHFLPVMYNQKNQARAEAANWSRNRAWTYASERFQSNAAGILIPSFNQGLWESENTILSDQRLKACLQAPIKPFSIRIENQLISIDQFPFETGLKLPYYLILIDTLTPNKAYVKNIEFRPGSKKNFLLHGQWLSNSGIVNLQQALLSKGSYQVYVYDPSCQQFWKTNRTFLR
jgi:hypothetical protein